MKPHFVIFSHGFGVKRDSSGVFPDIIKTLPPEITPIQFDYNIIDDKTNTITITPVDQQIKKLRGVIMATREAHPDAIIDIVSHSAGGAITAQAQPEGIRRFIAIAPNPVFNAQAKIDRWKERLGIAFDMHKTTSYTRSSDGGTTLVPPEYWASLQDVDIQALYNKLSSRTDVTLIIADQDQVLGATVFDALAPNVKVIHLDGDHNFNDPGHKAALASVVVQELTA